MNIDPAKVVHAAQQGIPLVVHTPTLPPQTERDLEDILGVFLKVLGREDLADRLSYCLKELTGNAKKANTKRAYFVDHGWDIRDPEVYDRGMRAFKTDTLDRIHHYLDLQERLGLAIRVTFWIRKQVLTVAVRNTAVFLPAERVRAEARLERSWSFGAVEDAVVDLLDDSEGAGLGIGILVLMLRKMGLDRRSFRLEAVEGGTEAVLTVPMDQARSDEVDQVTDDLARVVDTLPPFPENLKNLLVLLEDPDVEFRTLAHELAKDPALTADVLRYLNSAQARGLRRIESLEEALRIVGLRGLQTLLYPYGAHKVLAPYLDRQRGLWENAVLVSSYASRLAQREGLGQADQTLAQIAGLLYNLGQIVLTVVQPGLGAKIQEFCRARGVSVDVFDALAQSINPSDLGARIATAWQFPASLVAVLDHQNSPQDAPEEFRTVAAVVHLAASFRWVDLGLMAYDQIQTSLVAPETLATLHGKLK